MRKLATAVLALAAVGFALPALACSGGSSESAQTSDYPTSTASAPMTPKPSGDGG